MDRADIALLLDILGNRNRRRIIDLLRLKPCYVTEISERLTVSPKAVIDHLQMLEQADILRYRLDKHRRKYYYLSNDITIKVDLRKLEQAIVPVRQIEGQVLHDHLLRLRDLLILREELERQVLHLDQEIDNQIGQIARIGAEMGEEDLLIMVALSLVYSPQNVESLANATGADPEQIKRALNSLTEHGIVNKAGTTYQIRGTYGE